MKRTLFISILLLLMVGINAQVLTNRQTVPSVPNTNVLLDGSSNFSAESGATNNMGKGIVIPSVDLVNFEFNLTLADGVTFPTFFDGMIVYNRTNGTTRTDGNRSSTETDVAPGLYLFFNPTGAVNQNVTDGYWMRIGSNSSGGTIVQITSISITGADNVNTGESIDLSVDILPTNATSRTILWSVSSGTGSAVIDALTGRLTGISSGTVSVYASALDGSGVQAVHEVTVNSVAVTEISIIGSSTVAVGGSIKLDVDITPSNASNKNVVWSVTNGAGSASIDAISGFLLGVSAGTVTVRATALDGSDIFAEKTITVEATNVQVSSITISGASSLNTNATTTYKVSSILPANATNTAVVWSVTNGTGTATINANTGVLTGKTAGTVKVKATAKDGSGIVSNILTVTIVYAGPAGTTPIANGVYLKNYSGKYLDLAYTNNPYTASQLKSYFTPTTQTLYVYNSNASSSYQQWVAAVSLCSGTEKRLPNIYELLSLQGKHSSLGITMYNWSSTEGGEGRAWQWTFVGTPGAYNSSKTTTRHARCVWSK